MSLFLVILGLVMFVMLVVLHELGHFIAARRGGVDVLEFGIGFPPRAWAKKMKSGFVFTVNLLPLGGFVRLKGEHDADKKPRSYGAADYWTKTKIMVAGVGMNLLIAFVLLTALAWLGMPKLIENQFTIKNDTKILNNRVLIGEIAKGSPAQKAGLKEIDQITAITPVGKSAEAVQSQEQLPLLTKAAAGQDVTISVVRDGQSKQLTAKLLSSQEVEASLKTDNPKGYLGIVPTEYTLLRSTWSAPLVAAGIIKQYTVLTLQGVGKALGSLVQGKGGQASKDVTGPVGIFSILKRGSLLGYQFILVLIAIISLTLAIFNILPIPALDGGRLFVTWLFRLSKRQLKPKTEDLIHGTGFAVLMALFVLITIVDIKRF